MRGCTRGTSCPTRARKDEVRTLSFSVIKPKITSVSQLPVKQLISFQTLAWLLLYLYSGYYKNKLYKFRGGSQKLGGRYRSSYPPGKISLQRPCF